MTATTAATPIVLSATMLAGPDRKRTDRLYSFRVTYRNPEPKTPGCVMTWEVSGGREPYQIALERLHNGGLRWHCDCADSVFAGGRNPYHVCKHVTGLKRCVFVETEPTVDDVERDIAADSPETIAA